MTDLNPATATEPAAVADINAEGWLNNGFPWRVSRYATTVVVVIDGARKEIESADLDAANAVWREQVERLWLS